MTANGSLKQGRAVEPGEISVSLAIWQGKVVPGISSLQKDVADLTVHASVVDPSQRNAITQAAHQKLVANFPSLDGGGAVTFEPRLLIDDVAKVALLAGALGLFYVVRRLRRGGFGETADRCQCGYERQQLLRCPECGSTRSRG